VLRALQHQGTGLTMQIHLHRTLSPFSRHSKVKGRYQVNELQCMCFCSMTRLSWWSYVPMKGLLKSAGKALLRSTSSSFVDAATEEGDESKDDCAAHCWFADFSPWKRCHRHTGNVANENDDR